MAPYNVRGSLYLIGLHMKQVTWIAACSILLAACGSGDSSSTTSRPQIDLTKRSIEGEAQGTTYHIHYFGGTDPGILKEAVDSILLDIDNSLSTWNQSSLITELNAADSGQTPFDDHFNYFTETFKHAREVYQKTGGVFDPTVGPLVNAWGFGFKNRKQMDASRVDSLMPVIGFTFENMRLSRTAESNKGMPGRVLYKRLPGMALDFNAIAQGYSVDVLGTYLRAQQISSFMVELGGEVLVAGTKADGSPWRIGIDKPEEGATERTLQATLELTDEAVATSGNYRKFYVVDGQKYAHTIDPKTGFPVKHGLLSATVVAETCWKADAYATAFMVMGTERSLAFLEEGQEKLEAYLIYSEGEEVKTFTTAGLQERLKAQED